jgi:hypothetical protein
VLLVAWTAKRRDGCDLSAGASKAIIRRRPLELPRLTELSLEDQADRRVADLMDRRFVALKAPDDQEAAVAVFRQYDRTALRVTDTAVHQHRVLAHDSETRRVADGAFHRGDVDGDGGADRSCPSC